LSESSRHADLVRLAESWILKNWSLYARSLTTLCDLPERKPEGKPVRIDGFAPDVYAWTFPQAVTVIAEAKCDADLTSRRSALQVRAFLDHLQYQNAGHFVLAIEKQQEPIARRLVRLAAQDVRADVVQLYTLTPLGGAKRIDATR
jgi:hypothetical protein